MSFSFDKSYWSAGPRDEPGYCSQQTLYNDLGKELLDHGFAGFNACILACESFEIVFWIVLNTQICDRWTNWCVDDVLWPWTGTLIWTATRLGQILQVLPRCIH
jgi:hypothetical protein